MYFIPIIYVACLQQIKMAPLRGLDKEWLQSWFKITFYCPGYFFPLCCILSVLFVFVFFFHNYKFKLREACLCLGKQNNKAFISFVTWSPLKRQVGLSCKRKIYTMNGAGLDLVVLREDNGILDKITICWWRLRKRSPCKFLNDSKLLLGNSKVFYRPKGE